MVKGGLGNRSPQVKSGNIFNTLKGNRQVERATADFAHPRGNDPRRRIAIQGQSNSTFMGMGW
jgi:hypothetical protein